MNQWHRVLVACILVVALCGLFIHADVTSEQRSRYPDATTLATEYESYVGEEILLFGTVTERTEDELTIRSSARGVSLTLRVIDISATVEPGGVVQVYGTVEQNHVLRAERVEVVTNSRFAELYKYGMSVIGVLGFLIVFTRYWRIDTETWTVVARDG